jgi:hypothetical protein
MGGFYGTPGCVVEGQKTRRWCMGRKRVLCALLGFLVGAGALSMGQEEDEELAQRLRELQKAVGKSLHRAGKHWVPPVSRGGYQLALLPVADLCAGVEDHIAPSHVLGAEEKPEGFMGGRSEEAPQFYGTIEELLELTRVFAAPQSWDSGGTLVASGPNLFVFAEPHVIDEVRRLHDGRLRPAAFNCVTVEAQVVECTGGLARSLRAGGGATLSGEKSQALEAAIAGGTAKRIFAGRVTGLAGQRSLLWHGRQVAVVFDSDGAVATDAASTVPLVDVVQAGGSLSVRPSLGEDPSLIRMEVSVRLDDLSGPIEQRRTEADGILDLTRVARTEATASLMVPPRTWAWIGAGAMEKGQCRIVLVRGTVLPRGGGGR